MKKYLSVMSRKTKFKCFGVLVLAAVSAVLASIWPVKLGELYTGISTGATASVSMALPAVLFFGFVYLSAECISVLRRVLLDCIIATHESETREKSVEKLLKMPISYYAGGLSGKKTAQLNQGVQGFSQLIKIACNDVFATVLTAICTLVQVLLNAPPVIVMIMLCYLALTIVISLLQIRSQNGIREDIVDQKNSLDGQICQSITNLELIRAMHAERYETARLRPGILNIGRTERKHHRYMGTFDSVKQFCKILFQVILILVSLIMILNGRMAPGAVITVCLLFQQLIRPIDEIYRFMDETASSVIKAKALLEIMSKPSDEVFAIPSGNGEIGKPKICFQDVLVTNPEKTKALAWYEDLSIPADKKTALQGASGCGKTTLIKCLTRFYPFIQGTVRLFGRELGSFSQKELSSLICYVPQKPFFFAGTVRENLVYGIEDEVSEEEMTEALRKACLIGEQEGALCKPWENPLTVELSEGAMNISGGQRQRLSIARTFLRKPKLYVFDESTAGLDQETAEAVLANIEDHASAIGAGILYISHDENVLKRCDEVIQVENKVQAMNHSIMEKAA